MNQPNCPFCTNNEPFLASNQHAFAILDKRPVSSGHCLVISRSHVPTVFDMSVNEYLGCFQLVREVRALLAKEYKAKSFHIVVNCGPEADQMVHHAHIHLVPRYPGVHLPRATDAWSLVR